MTDFKKMIILLLAVINAGTWCMAQKKILPGDASLNTAFLPNQASAMRYFAKSGGNLAEIASFETDFTNDGQEFIVTTTLNSLNSNKQWKDVTVTDSKTFKPLRRYSEQDKRTFNLNFGTGVTGDYTNNQTTRKSTVKHSVKGPFFDISTYPYVLQMLPLNTGYRAVIPVYDQDAEQKDRLYNVVVKEVKSDVYISEFTGEHPVFKATVFEESTGHTFDYYFDKENHRRWQVEILTKNGDRFVLKDKEIDFNPFKNKFNKDATYKMITEGNSAIKGVAFARDNEGRFKGIAILNVNKKQFAQKGTRVTLVPYTAYYKEWIEVNEKQAKVKGAAPIPLPEAAYECIKFSEVYDDEGHFEFTNLMPGEYLLIVSFGYIHRYSRTEEVGRAAVYVNGAYQGDHVYTDVFSYTTNNTANIEKVITIKNDGEIIEIKLKKTL